jgi:hypothetical protein
MRGIGLVRRAKLACSVGALAWALLCLTPVAARAALTWSQPLFLNAGMNFVSPGLDALSCPSAAECVAVDSVGREVSFDPSVPANWSAHAIDASRALVGVSCPAVSQCTAVDGSGTAVTFDPGSGDVAARQVIDPQAQAAAGEIGGQALTGVACPSTALCVAVDSGGQVVSFVPGSSSGTQIETLGNHALSVACPSSAQCSVLASPQPAIDGTVQGESLITVDPHSLAIQSTLALPETLALRLIACPTNGECVAAGYGDCSSTSCGQEGGTVSFDPETAAASAFTDRSSADFISLACAGAALCTAMDASGTATSFDPAVTGNLAQTQVDPLGDWPKGLNGAQIACPSISSCVLATWNAPAAITFAPQSLAAAAPVAIDDAAPIAAVSCPAVGECVGLANTQGRYTLPTGAGALLDPGSQSHADAYPLILGVVDGLVCPNRTQCTAVATQTDPALDNSEVVTFNPHRPPWRRRPAPLIPAGIRIDGGARVDGLACPAARQCTAVDSRGRELTFDPRRPRGRVMHAESATRLTGLACPTATQCTALDGHGNEVTFEPWTGAAITTRRIDGRGSPAGVACPSVRLCSAIDQRGRELTFDPRSRTRPIGQQIDRAALTSIACPSQSLCVAVDSAGDAVAGDPKNARRWALSPIPGATSLLAVSCPSTRVCIATDSIGQAFAASIGS